MLALINYGQFNAVLKKITSLLRGPGGGGGGVFIKILSKLTL